MNGIPTKVTVFIATCNRARLLRDALESVQRQTGRQAIGSVIVSENGVSDESAAVCAEFPDLPIDYVQQRPPVPPLLHTKQIWPRVRNPLVAILHDDDWWDPDHLEDSLNLLTANPSCAAVFSNYYETIGPAYPVQVQERGWPLWLAADCDFRKPFLILNAASVMLSCLINACLHFSSLVGRTEFIWNAYAKVLATENAFDNDRTFPMFLSSYGNLGYLTRPSVFVRRHSDQYSMHPTYQRDVWKLVSETTKRIVSYDPSTVALAAARLGEILNGLDQHQRAIVSQLMNSLGEPHRSTLIQDCGFPIASATRNPRRATWFFRQCCPPALDFAITKLVRASRRVTKKNAKK